MATSACVAIVMSRIPRLVAAEPPWLSGLRAGLTRISRRQQTLLFSPGTAACDFILRGARHLNLPTQLLGSNDSLETAVRDQQLVQQADEILVLGVRPHGNIQHLLTARLQAGRLGVVLVDLPHLQSDTVRRELLELGATLWRPPSAWTAPLQNPADRENLSRQPTTPDSSLLTLAALPIPAIHPVLTHTTRACPGPWPEQSPEEYLDHLLAGHPHAEHSALNTLLRIVTQRRLIASSRTIRGGYPMVSFTAVPVRELPALRRFNGHRHRWDFEPYAIVIHRDVLINAGAQPAIYGDDACWSKLNDSRRPYFQFSGHRECDNTTPRQRDWTLEQEWRHPGDLHLADLPQQGVMILVPDTAAARKLQPHSPWPITLWPGEINA